MGVVVLITGVPGTGKSELSKALCASFEGALCLSVSEVALAHDLVIAYDFVRKTFVIDETRLNEKLKELIKEANIAFIESVEPCLLQDDVDLVVVTRCSNVETLTSRLVQRGWASEKIEENIEAETLGIVEVHAHSCHGRNKVIIADTCVEDMERIATIIADKVRAIWQGKHPINMGRGKSKTSTTAGCNDSFENPRPYEKRVLSDDVWQ